MLQHDIDFLREYRQILDIEVEDPSIEKIANAIYLREKDKPNSRSSDQVHDNTWPGFGAEIAFQRAISRAKILNEGIVDISESTYQNLQRDIVLDERHIAIKSLDRSRYRTQVWISERQKKSIRSCAKFCDELVFMSYVPKGGRRYLYSCTGIISDLAEFSQNFDKYARKTGNSFSYELDVSLAERRGIYLDLIDNSVYNRPISA
jgi:hypothetical protein